MSRRLYTADLHLGHEKVASVRGYDSVADHDDAIMAPLLELGKGDQLWILGDLHAGGAAGEEHALDLLAEIDERVELFLVAGNHDRCWPGHRDAHRHTDTYLEVFDSVSAFARFRVNGDPILASHFPYVGDHTEAERYPEFRLRDTGAWLLHGHTHATEAYQPAIHPRQICVSVDAWGRPVTDGEVIAIVAATERGE
ncbi:metallophosphoesterase [Gordonia phage ObLaDi]|uniref:Metallophosphoesterase n=1 Tax=Gordonia phage ObLaDi TaxID=2978487 RepID=A0A977PRI7_9CAUD|nr:metallophosphoesterase [Gordonia phage ObLaDi]